MIKTAIKYPGVLLLIFFTQVVYPQNLVKNPGFEEYHFLPGDFYRSDTFYCKDWFIPNNNSVDFFTLEKPYNSKGQPYIKPGDHFPNSGKSYIGLFPFTWYGSMEQVTGTLIEPLLRDSLYEFHIYLRFEGSSSQFCLKKFEIYFSEKQNIYSLYNDPFYEEMFKFRQITADIVFDISELCDSVYWKQYHAIYKAMGGERFLTLGMFYQEHIDLNSIVDEYRIAWPKGKRRERRFLRKYKDTSILKVNQNYIPDDIFDNGAYYFIDDVSLELFKPAD
ncbi:MAG: hypothetical protein JXB19_11690 [Bacteroidales bacterium]|nr:hypothetical protein [Bacteroidales bacterium]